MGIQQERFSGSERVEKGVVVRGRTARLERRGDVVWYDGSRWHRGHHASRLSIDDLAYMD